MKEDRIEKIGLAAIAVIIGLIFWAYAKGPNNEVVKPKANPKIAKLLKKIKKEGFVRGNKKARYTILEYTELVCPFCKRHSTGKTLEKVMEKNKDKVNIISRVFLVHPQAQKLEETLLCAQDDKDSKKYYNFLTDAFAADKIDEQEIIKIAVKNKYDKTKLTKCLDSKKYAGKVEQQTNEGRDNFDINGTPGNVIVDSKTGAYVIVEGAYPVEEFIKKLEILN